MRGIAECCCGGELLGRRERPVLDVVVLDGRFAHVAPVVPCQPSVAPAGDRTLVSDGRPVSRRRRLTTPGP